RFTLSFPTRRSSDLRSNSPLSSASGRVNSTTRIVCSRSCSWEIRKKSNDMQAHSAGAGPGGDCIRRAEEMQKSECGMQNAPESRSEEHTSELQSPDH